MKGLVRNLMIILFLMFSLLLLSACAEDSLQITETNLEESIFESSNQSENLVFDLENNIFDSKTRSIRFSFTNNSDNEYTYAKPPHLEVLIEDTWYTLINSNNSNWAKLEFILLPHDTYKDSFDLSNFQNNLYQGEYRLVQEFDSKEKEEFAIVNFKIED